MRLESERTIVFVVEDGCGQSRHHGLACSWPAREFEEPSCSCRASAPLPDYPQSSAVCMLRLCTSHRRPRSPQLIQRIRSAAVPLDQPASRERLLLEVCQAMLDVGPVDFLSQVTSIASQKSIDSTPAATACDCQALACHRPVLRQKLAYDAAVYCA